MAELSTLGAVIKAAYEGQANTNAFTDAEKAKLAEVIANAIESAAGFSLKLGDDAGAFVLAVLDSGDVVVASIDSNGNVVASGGFAGQSDSGFVNFLASPAGVGDLVGLQAYGSSHATVPNQLALVSESVVVLDYTRATKIWALKDTNALRLSTDLTVSGLPGSPAVGMIARVTDADTPAIGSTVVGAGASPALLWYNGTDWTVIGV